MRRSCLKTPTPPPQLSSSTSNIPPTNTNPHPRSLRWNEPIAQFRAIPAKEDDYYSTFPDLPFNIKAEEQEDDELPIPFLRSQPLQSKPLSPTPELQFITPASEGDDDDTNMNIDLIPSEQAGSAGGSGSSSELDHITLLEIGDFTMPPSTTWFSPRACTSHGSDDAQRLQNLIVFANLNPGYGILNQQLKHLTLEPILQEPQPEQVVQVEAPTTQHSRNIIGMFGSSSRNGNQAQYANGDDIDVLGNAISTDTHATGDLQSSALQGSPRAPLATIQTNTPCASPSPGPNTANPTHVQNNSETHSELTFNPDFRPNQHPSHRIQANHKYYPKPRQSAHPGSRQQSTLTPGQSVSPAHPLHHHTHTNNTTAPVLTGLGAYSKDTNTQPPRPAGGHPSSLLPRPTAAPRNAGAITGAQPQSAEPHTNAPPRAELDAPDYDVEMEPPVSESESEDGEIFDDEEDQADQLIDDGPKLEEGEIGLDQNGPIGAALSSHIAVFRASQASGVSSSSASERRQLARRKRRAGVLGLGAIGGGRADTSQRTGTGASRLGGAVVRRARTTHVPSIAGHIQHPSVTTLESALVYPATATKPYYPLPISTVHGWRTELECLASLYPRPGSFKNPSQYAAELSSVLKQIEENEEHPDLTVEVLKETRLMQVLKKFQHCNQRAGPGIRDMVPRVQQICKRCRARLRKMDELDNDDVLPVVTTVSNPVDNAQSQAQG